MNSSSKKDTRLKVRRINSGAYGKIVFLVDNTGRTRECSAGNDVIAHLDAIHYSKTQFFKM